MRGMKHMNQEGTERPKPRITWKRNTVEKKCLRCGKAFLQQSPWQEYCDNACNQAQRRERKSEKP